MQHTIPHDDTWGESEREDGKKLTEKRVKLDFDEHAQATRAAVVSVHKMLYYTMLITYMYYMYLGTYIYYNLFKVNGYYIITA